SLRQNHEKPIKKILLKLADKAFNSTLSKRTRNIEYDDKSLVTKKQKCEEIVKTVDQEQIARHAYR
ncbi:10402_t:CDS:2, partial [Gigaspora margarita]